MKIKSKNFCRKAACIGLTAVMCITFAAGQLTAAVSSDGNATADGGSTGGYSVNFTNANGSVDLSAIKIANFNSSVQEINDSQYATTAKTVIVRLSGDALLDGGSESVIEKQQSKFLKELAASGISYEYKAAYSNVLNAVAVEVPLGSVSAIKAMSNVSTVSVSSTYARPDETESSGSGQQNASKIYANGIYDSSEYTAKGIDGSGMTVAILDTGLDYTHDAFAESKLADKDNVSFTKSYIEDVFGNCELNAEKSSGATAGDVYVSAKVPFAYDYADNDADVYPSYSQHGTHVAGIIAGNDESYTDKDGNVAVDENGEILSFKGVAPEAQLVICKVFTDDLDSEDLGGATTEDILAALEDCVALNVDIINMSLGTTAGFSSASLGLSDADDEGYLLQDVFGSIRAKGITLMVAASNDFSAGYGSEFGTNLASNPDSGTVGSPSTYDGAMSVASINGQYSPYILANPVVNGDTVEGDAIYYEESRNEDSDAYNFLDDMLGEVGSADAVSSATFKYVVVPGYGDTTNYTQTVKNALKNKEDGEKVIAVVKRGGDGLTFKKKIQIAKGAGADAVIVYNNVSGMIRMSLEDLEDRIPAVSVSLEAGESLIKNATGSVGSVTLNRSFVAGPFMNDYSSWGVTPDLKLKPDVTSHGGEITSTVAGGYAEMSGTSMACPNLAGFTALLRGQLKKNNTALWQSGNSDTENALNLSCLTNNIMMSTASIVFDQNKLPYSPRKQGSGLATLDNALNTSAYLFTKNTTDTSDAKYMCDDGRPKAELGEDEEKKGEYTIYFYVSNFGSSQALKFKTQTYFFTETLSKDGLSVAEKAYMFDSKGQWKVNGKAVAEGGEFEVPAGATYEIEVKLTLSDAEKKYLDDTFVNGMFVEGFLQLGSLTEGQCDLSLPFLAFYGDWEAAPMLDYDCFEIAAFDKDTSLSYEERPKESVWATQAYSYYWNEKYSTPLGSFLYLQDPSKEHTSEYVYTEEEHIAISGLNDYYADDEDSSYYTVTGIKALYAGLLRNAEIVTYTLTCEDTGEIIPDENGNDVREFYRARKAYSGGGSAVPSQVLLELRNDEMMLNGNGKYRLDFYFYFKYSDYAEGNGTDDTFSMSFYIDYEAPVLVDSRIRYQDSKDSNGKTTQTVWLDLDVYDNHYPQAVILCYSDSSDPENSDIDALKLATEYITPIINPEKNSTTTVSIDVTDFYETYKGYLFVEIDDYAMNHNVYYIDSLNYAEGALITPGWTVNDSITVAKNSTATAVINNIGSANLSNFTWVSANPAIATVKNGEIFGVAEGTTVITVSDGAATVYRINVEVTESDITLKTPTVTFGTMLNDENIPVKAQGTVEVNSGQEIPLSLVMDPWYYPTDDLTFEWKTSDETIATVDQNGNVKVVYEDDDVRTVTITAQCKERSSCRATVTLSVQDPFTVSNGTLTSYHGLGGELKDGVLIGGEYYDNVRVLTIPTDKAITTIGEDAFKDVDTVEVVIIPKTVTTINQTAFENCVNLKKICFISEDKQDVADSSLNLIHRYAFKGCTSLTTVDLTNCKVITLDSYVFTGCTALKEVIKMTAIGTAYDYAFAYTGLEEADLSGLHVAGNGVFTGCTKLESITTDEFTSFGAYMFSGCTSLGSDGIELNLATIPEGSFRNCNSLSEVTLTASGTSIGANAFYNCNSLSKVEVSEGASVSSVGDYAFYACYNLDAAALTDKLTDAELGYNIFAMVGVNEKISDGKLIMAASTIESADYLKKNDITEIGAYAFSGSSLKNNISTLDLSGITKIGEGAFYGLSGLKSVTIPKGITEIPDYAFAETGLTSVTIPSTVTKIGAYAFYGCESLTNISFADGCLVAEIGAGAFYGSGISGSLTLPSTLVTLGDYAFAECANLTSVTIPSAEYIGEGAFMNCTKLAAATYGDGAYVTGSYTFYAYDEASGTQVESSLTSVTFGTNITEIGTGAFAYCAKLEEIDLLNATAVGDGAFAACTSLESVTGLDKVTEFGMYAFAECAITEANLAAAKVISYQAFINCGNLETLTLGSSVEGVGDEAFAGTALTGVTIPASCTYVGTSAFSGKVSYGNVDIATLKAYTVEDDNALYFADDGVLYQYIGGKNSGKYALVAYPEAKKAALVDDVRTYEVKEGTITIGKFAFGSVPSSSVAKIIFPYTLTTIGNGAFYASGITTYTFESIDAPVLLEDYIGRTITNDYSVNSFFYLNFLGCIAGLAPHYPGDTSMSERTLTIEYPSNGVGYDNFIYSNYFGTKTVLAEMPENNTRTLISMLSAMPEASEVGTWTTANKTQADVEAFAAQVKQAHVYKNALATAAQSAFVGDTLLNKLSDVEAALKSVKLAFGIKVVITGTAIYSGLKTEYAVGDPFSLDGLMIKVTYDDYSEEIVSADGNFELASNYDRPLSATDNKVTLTGIGAYAGATVNARGLRVTEASGGTTSDDGFPVWAIVVIAVAAAAVIAAAVATVIILRKKKSNAAVGASAENSNGDGDKPDEG